MKIEPCPWCGGTDVQIAEGTTFRWRVARCGCGAQCGEVRIRTIGGTHEENERRARRDAIEAWNDRWSDDSGKTA